MYKKQQLTCFYMPIWDLAELKSCRNAVPLFSGITDEALTETFRHWGGSARYCLAKLAFEASICQPLLDEFHGVADSLPPQSCELMITAQSLLRAPKDNISHRFLHLIPTPSLTQVEEITLCSSLAGKKLISKANQLNYERVKWLFQTIISSSTVYSARSSVCLLYQKVVFTFLSSGNPIPTYSLGHSKSIGSIFLHPEEYYTIENADDIPALVSNKEIHPDRLLVPLVQCFPSIDAFTKSGRLFQVTVSERHPILKEHVNKLLVTLKCTPSKAQFIFVTPHQSYSPQPWKEWVTIERNKKELQTVEVANPKQYSCHLHHINQVFADSNHQQQ
jgi:hypothetical protein